MLNHGHTNRKGPLMSADGLGLRVTVLGCSGTYSSTESACSGYLIRSATTAVVLDAGPGTSMELQRHLALEDIDAFIISHEHPDHWTELPSLYHAFRFGIRRFNVPTYGTAGTRELLGTINPEALEYSFEWTDINEHSRVSVGDIEFTFSETDHPVETLAIRAECDGQSIVYSADTGPGWSPTAFDAPIDLMVYESSLPVRLEDEGIPHVSGREAGIRASDAGVRTLVLTHVPPGEDAGERQDAAASTFDGPIQLATAGATFFPA